MTEDDVGRRIIWRHPDGLRVRTGTLTGLEPNELAVRVRFDGSLFSEKVDGRDVELKQKT